MVPGGPLFPVSLHFSGRFRCKKIAESNNPPIVSFLYSLYVTQSTLNLLKKTRNFTLNYSKWSGIRTSSRRVCSTSFSTSFLFISVAEIQTD